MRRIAAFSWKTGVEFTLGEAIVRLRNPDDTLYVPMLCTTQGRMQIEEIWDFSDVLPLIAQADSLLSKPSDDIRVSTPLATLLSIAYPRDAISHVAGIVYMKDTPRVDSLLALPQIRAIFDKKVIFRWAPRRQGNDAIELIAVKPGRSLEISSKTVNLSRVFVSRPRVGKLAELNIRLKPKYAWMWRQMTADNIGLSLAFVLDGRVVCYPRVAQEIPNGDMSLSWTYNSGEALAISALITGGRLYENQPENPHD